MTDEELTRHIADELGETRIHAQKQIARIITLLGPDRARSLCQQAQDIQGTGGMPTLDGTRRRTLGGIFFRLVYETAPDIARQLRQWQAMRKRRQAEASAVLQKAAAAGGETLPIASDTKANICHPAAIKSQNSPNKPVKPVEEDQTNRKLRTNEKGCTVKIVLTGRPEKVIDKDSYVKLSMRAKDVPALPKGLPTPAPISTQYVVVISARQWHQVAGALKDESDSLLVEGWPQINAQAGNVAVFATSCTTKKLQQQKRSAQLVGAGK